MKRTILFLLIAIVALANEAKAQDPHFSQFYANPLYINPALAGANICPRANLAYRDQWPSIGAFKTFTASYDQYFDALSGGLGILLLNDKQSESFINNYAQLMYSLRLRVSKSVFMNLALSASVANRSIDWSSLTFPDMIDPKYGFIHNTQAQAPENQSHTYLDFGAGAVFYGDNWYGGFSFAHLTQPDEGFISYSRLPLKTTIHGGMRLNISRDKRRTNAFFGAPIISPNIIYHNQGGFHDLNYGVYLDWSPFIVGAWFRQAISFENADAFIFMVGIQKDFVKIGYSYDITVSPLSNVSGGAHEVTLGLQFNCPEKKAKIKAIDCPSF